MLSSYGNDAIFSVGTRREPLTVKVQSARVDFFWPENSRHRTTGNSSTFGRIGRRTYVLYLSNFLGNFDASVKVSFHNPDRGFASPL